MTAPRRVTARNVVAPSQPQTPPPPPPRDKRDECGCHRGCTALPHDCEQKCVWPACLTEPELAELDAQLAVEGL